MVRAVAGPTLGDVEAPVVAAMQAASCAGDFPGQMLEIEALAFAR